MRQFTVNRKFKRNLSDWILDFDNKFLHSTELNNENKEILNNIYNKSSILRKDFHKKYLPLIFRELDSHSCRDLYKYEYFFKHKGISNFELSNNDKTNSHIKILKKNYSNGNLDKL